MSQSVTYLRIQPEAALPAASIPLPTRVVVVADSEVSAKWQEAVSNWLVQSGCLYMMAWGDNCSSWDDSVDVANSEEFKFGEIPADRFVMTTWHTNEPLAEVFWFSKNHACHPTVELKRTVLLHIGVNDRGQELLTSYADA
jgi:hypothetical protein